MKFLVLIALIFLYVVDSSPVIESENHLEEPEIPKPEDLFEGDIAGIEKNERGAYQKPTKSATLWPNGYVPYMIDPSANFGSSELSTIRKGLRHIEDITNPKGFNKVVKSYVIYFNEIKLEDTHRYSNYIKVIRGVGCYSNVGRQKKQKYQYLSLGYGCLTVGTVAHEFMHALGFFHEQSRPDRDDYVTVYYQNIQVGQEVNFDKYTWNVVGLKNFPYDYGSIMHYGKYEFSGNGQPTIVPNKNFDVPIGQRSELSKQDAAEIIAVYGSGNKSIFTQFHIMLISLFICILTRVYY